MSSPTISRSEAIAFASLLLFLAGLATRLQLNAAARECGALPVYADIGAVFFLRPDGEILGQSNMHEEAPAVETDPMWRLVALVTAARKFPELAPLLPPRPEHAVSCADCGGVGQLFGAGCGVCYGLGWAA